MVSSWAVRPLGTPTLNFTFAFADLGSARATEFFLEAPQPMPPAAGGAPN